MVAFCYPESLDNLTPNRSSDSRRATGGNHILHCHHHRCCCCYRHLIAATAAAAAIAAAAAAAAIRTVRTSNRGHRRVHSPPGGESFQSQFLTRNSDHQLRTRVSQRMTEGIRIEIPYCICPPAQCTDLYGTGTRGRGRCAELSCVGKLRS